MLPSEFFLSFLLLLSYIIPSVHSTFTFNFGVPGSCDNLEVSWTGGQGPFELILVPVFGTPRIYKIPSSAVNNGRGLYQVQVNFPVNQKMLLAMSDATGFGSGGTSLITQVGPSVSGNSCNTTDPGVDFTFSLDSALTQCRNYAFTQYDSAIQPVTITGFIPGGHTFQLTPPTGQNSFNWQAALEAGTSVIFFMTDSRDRNGGSSGVILVGSSGDSSCLGSNYPTSTTNPPTPISASAGPSTSAGPPTSPGQSNGKNGGPNTVVLALASLGGVLALALVASLVFFCFQRKRKRDAAYSEGLYSHRGKRGSRRVSLDPEEPRPIDNVHGDQTVSRITPFSGSQATSSSAPLRHSRDDLRGPNLIPPRSSNAPSKASQAGAFKQPRYVMHTDVEDATPEEVIELPPTYSERRGPVPPSTIERLSYTDYQSSLPS